MKKLSLDELNRLSPKEFETAPRNPVVVVLDNIRSLRNVGSAFRTADAFACQRLVLCGFTGRPPHREITRTALGAEQTIDWQHEESTTAALQKLKAEGYKIIIVEQTSTSLPLHSFDIETNQQYALVFGNEVEGVSQEALLLTDAAVEIPQYGTKHSINVAVCMGIVCWEFTKNAVLK